MPDIMEISGLLGGGLGRRHRRGMDLREALVIKGLGRSRRRKISKAKVSPATRRVLAIGPTAERALQIAEDMLAQGKKPLAVAWARQAEIKAKAAGKSMIARRAQEIIKEVRGEAVLHAAANLGDVEMIFLGRKLGLI